MVTSNRTTGARSSTTDRRAGPPVVEVVVPVYNEARELVGQIHRLHEALRVELPLAWQITIADNGSTDDTAALADELAADLPDVAAVHLSRKGRGRALRATWTQTRAAVVAYTDVDLSTDLRALFPLVASVLSGHAAIAVGSRLAPGSQTTRGPKRELISRSYNLLLRVVLGTRVRDAQCGFKAMRADLARALLPEVDDQAWFFDTELLVRAERHGLRVREVPVDWVDDPDSRVDILRTARDDLRGVWRLVRELGLRRPAGPLVACPVTVALEHSEAA
jgi:glycosyltransferase involved in cell wall biosynthesis